MMNSAFCPLWSGPAWRSSALPACLYPGN
jgi:hypothetical protein